MPDPPATIDPTPVEEIAQSIIRIDEAMKKINASGLSQRALCLLLADITSVNYTTCFQVINGLHQLKQRFVVPPKGSDAKK